MDLSFAFTSKKVYTREGEILCLLKTFFHLSLPTGARCWLEIYYHNASFFSYSFYLTKLPCESGLPLRLPSTQTIDNVQFRQFTELIRGFAKCLTLCSISMQQQCVLPQGDFCSVQFQRALLEYYLNLWNWAVIWSLYLDIIKMNDVRRTNWMDFLNVFHVLK